MLEEFVRAKCLLCGGTMPAHDLETQIEHMTGYHKAKSREEAEQMAKTNFVQPGERERESVDRPKSSRP